MPFVKREIGPRDKPVPGDNANALKALRSPDPDVRWNAARSLGADSDSVAALAATLDSEPVPRVREAIMTALMRIGTEASVKVLLPYLRSQDASRRGAAIEALQALPDATAPFMATLLRDEDSDVRILAIELVRGMPASQATRLLCDVLQRDPHPNVCGSAVDALAEIGTVEALPALRACGRRFADKDFLSFAIAVTVARIAGEG